VITAGKLRNEICVLTEANFDSKFMKEAKYHRRSKAEVLELDNYAKSSVSKPLRRMNIASASLLLARFDKHLRLQGLDTLVSDLEGFRDQKIDVKWFMRQVFKKGDKRPMKERKAWFRQLVWGSPKLRYIIHEVVKHVVDRKEKVLIIEDTPYVAWFWELAIQFLHIDAAVLHSKLSAEDRETLISDFNDKDSNLKALIIMINMSAVGLNLDKACHIAIVASRGPNAALETQAWGRLIRVSIIQSVS
jgi:Helicase conserved C-terminal domain